MGLGNRIETGWSEGSTAKETANRQPGSPPGPERLDRLAGVFRARWCEAARRWAAFPTDLVEANGPQHDALRTRGSALLLGVLGHGRRSHDSTPLLRICGTARDRSAKETVAAGRVSPHRYKPGAMTGAWLRMISRSRRRARLRCTAVPAERPMAKATRGPSNEGSRTMTHHTAPLRTRVPSRRSRENSSRPRRRWIKLTAACGPSGVGP